MNWKRVGIFPIGCIALVYICEKVDKCAFRNDSLTVLGKKLTPEWQPVNSPKSWLNDRVDALGYVSSDGESTKVDDSALIQGSMEQWEIPFMNSSQNKIEYLDFT